MQKTQRKSAKSRIPKQAEDKLGELLHCGNERIELSAAKEILALAEEKEKTENEKVELEVTIRIVGED